MKLLKTLCGISSVTGNTENIRNFIISYCKENNYPCRYIDGAGTVVGNDKSKTLFVAHIDEVGIKVKNINSDGSLNIETVGWLDANMIQSRTFEFESRKGDIVYGVCVPKKVVQVKNIKTTKDLFIHVGTDNKSETIKLGLNKGSFGRVKHEYWENEKFIFSGSLDNKLSVYVLLEFIQKNPDVLNHFAFGFTEDEEISNKMAIKLVKFIKPKYVFPVDGIVSSMLKKYSDDTCVPYTDYHYKIKNELKLLLKDIPHRPISFWLPELGESEPVVYEKNSKRLSFHTLIPLFNYHNGTYVVSKVAINNSLKFISKLIGKLI